MAEPRSARRQTVEQESRREIDAEKLETRVRSDAGQSMTLDMPRSPIADRPTRTRSRWKTIRETTGAVGGAVLGIAPHVVHHIGLLAGAALITGASGNVIFYFVGLVLSIPMLRRLYHHYGAWWAPAVAVVAFTGLFSLSAFVIGPAIAGSGDAPSPSTPTPVHSHQH